jgi:cyclohexyl-isocyanide hydratase
VLCRVPEMRVTLLGVDREPIRTEHGMMLVPQRSFAEAGPLDIVVIPGGTSINDTLLDRRYLDFVATAGARAQWVTSVCTGSLLLAAADCCAGIGRRRTGAQSSSSRHFGAIPVADERVVVDRNRVTAAGVSAGIDFALLLASKICGDAAAQQIQLGIEYDPSPIFNSGHPRCAPADVVAGVEKKLTAAIERRRMIRATGGRKRAAFCLAKN